MTSISSESTLTVTEPSDTVKNRLQGTLEAAERALTRASRTGRMHQRATTCAVTALILLGAGFYLVAGITVGKQASFSSFFSCSGLGLTVDRALSSTPLPHWHLFRPRHFPPPTPGARAHTHAALFCRRTSRLRSWGSGERRGALPLHRARGSKEPKASLVRMSDLDTFIADLKAVIRDHGHKAWSKTRLTPEMGARLEWNERRFVYEDAGWSLLTRRQKPDNSKDSGCGSGSAV